MFERTRQIVDLHCHTSASTGGVGKPPDVVVHLKQAGYGAFSLAEHNSIGSYDGTREIADELGIEFIPGVELSVEAVQPITGENFVHLLGYCYDNVEPLTRFCGQTTERVENALEEFLARLFASGKADVSEEDLREEVRNRVGDGDIWKRSMSGDVIGAVLTRKGILPPDGSVTVQMLFDQLCPDLRAELLLPLEEGIRTLRDAGATIILAHPLGAYKVHGDSDTPRKLTEWLERYVDGLEVFYPTYGCTERTALLDIVHRMERPCTGGSDSHVFDRPECIRPSDAPYACVEALYQFRREGRADPVHG